MTFTWDTITFINLVMCIIILVFGIMGYQRSKNLVPLYIGIAFGLFGFSHISTMLGLKDSLNTLLIFVRLGAYLLVTYATYLMVFRKK
jgi:uncharacterized membrane protein (UPF0136 family)